MPYNAGYNAPTGMYGGYGFGNRLQGGGRINNVWGYDDNSNPLNSNQQYAQYQQSQQQPAYGSPQAGNPMDFFSRMAGMAGGMSPQGSPAGNQSPSNWNATHSYNIHQNPIPNPNDGLTNGQMLARYGQILAPTLPAQIITPGGQGPYGGVSPEGQRQMFEGTARAWGDWGQRPGSHRPSLFETSVGTPSRTYGSFR